VRAKALDCDTIEIWFADEARIGQKNKITRRWAKRGTRPSAPRDQRNLQIFRQPLAVRCVSARAQAYAALGLFHFAPVEG
jgi:hypothetical protein